ncbi:helix-turn-helix domain-containing protein [Anaerobutyricum hallii]|nr:helix-turn-helix transcriptional regulator [Anaerobutyricum hallii]
MGISVDKLKELRKAKGFSQEELSKSSDIPVKTIQSWEQGVRMPRDIYVIERLCNALEISIDDLLHDELTHAEAMRNSEIGDYEEVRINTLIQYIYNEQGLTGILKVIDRFIYEVGRTRAIEIIEGVKNESD